MKTFLYYSKFINIEYEDWLKIFCILEDCADEYWNENNESGFSKFCEWLSALPINMLVLYRETTKFVDAHKHVDHYLNNKINSYLSRNISITDKHNYWHAIMRLVKIYSQEYRDKKTNLSYSNYYCLLEALPVNMLEKYRDASNYVHVVKDIDDILAKKKSIA